MHYSVAPARSLRIHRFHKTHSERVGFFFAVVSCSVLLFFLFLLLARCRLHAAGGEYFFEVLFARAPV